MLWERLAAQCAAVAGPWDRALGTERELFRLRPDGRRTARCVLVDTEPKVGYPRACRFKVVASMAVRRRERGMRAGNGRKLLL